MRPYSTSIFWDAQACYFHDPAGNIVEFIAHRGLAEVADVTRSFSPRVSWLGFPRSVSSPPTRAPRPTRYTVIWGSISGPVAWMALTVSPLWAARRTR